MKYGITNAKAKIVAGGGDLNFYYGLTPPSDTTKIWVRTGTTPSSIEITTEPVWSNEIRTATLKSDLENITDAFLCRAGEYVYVIGGIKNSESRNVISRYNTITGDYEDVATLPYGLQNARAIAYKDYIYIFWGYTWVVNTRYYQCRMIKYNWKTNKMFTGQYNIQANSTPDTSTFWGGFNIYRVGTKIFFFFGEYPIVSNYYPDSTKTLYAIGNSGTASSSLRRATYYDIEKDAFMQTQQSNGNAVRISAYTQTIKKAGVSFGGIWGGSSSLPQNCIMAVGNDTEGETAFRLNNRIKTITLYGTKNVILTTNDRLYVCGSKIGDNQSTIANMTNSTDIWYIDYEAGTYTKTNYTMPISIELSNLQYNEQTSYGRGETYLVEVNNPIELEENKMMIIPDCYNEDETTLGTLNGLDLKVAIQSVYIGNKFDEAEEVRLYQYDGTKWVGINCDDYTPLNNNCFSIGCQWLDTTNTSLTMGITCNVGDLIIASVIARDNGNETASAGWELIGRSQAGYLNQTLAFYKKVAESTFEEITITQSSNARIYISMVNFVGNFTATLGEFTKTDNSIQGSITLPNKLCLVSASSNLWIAYAPFGDWSYKDSNNQNVDVIRVWKTDLLQQRLGTWIDDLGGERVLITPIDSGTENSVIVGYLIIERPQIQEDYF